MKEEIPKKLLKKIVTQLADPISEKLVDLLYTKQNVNEFLIAKKLDLTINQTRNILYKLADEDLVGFIRKKDKKKGGWYTYFWTLKIKKSLTKFQEEIKKNLEDLKSQLKTRETIRHFYCKNCELEYDEENAMLLEYTCAECGEVLEIRDSKEITNHLRGEIEKLSKSLEQINQEIEIIEAKEQKAKDRKLKAEQKKKELERKKRKAERDREKEKAARKLERVKKKPKKKTKKKVKKKTHKKKPSKKQKKKFWKKPKRFSKKFHKSKKRKKKR